MSTIRGWIYYLVLAVTLVPLAIVLIILYPASLAFRYRLAMNWARFMLKMGEVICGMRYQFKGLENFPTDGTSVLVLSKHQSAWDIFAGALQAPIRLGYFRSGFSHPASDKLCV